jgi:type II secretory pathway pseudopilin PulG
MNLLPPNMTKLRLQIKTCKQRSFSLVKKSRGASRQGGADDGFTLVEAVVATGILTIVFVAVFALLTFNLTITSLSRENSRATQVLLDKMECLRLYQWQQLTNPAVLSTNFINWTYESTNAGTTNAIGQGTRYVGKISVTTPVTALSGTSYGANLALVQVTVSWSSGNTNLTHTRSMATYFSRLGVENAIRVN